MAAMLVAAALLLVGAYPPPVEPPAGDTITPSEFASGAVAAATIANVTVTGSVTIDVPDLTLRGSEIQGTINLGPHADHVVIVDSRAVGFEAAGSDNIVMDRNVFDGGRGKLCQNFIWPGPDRDPSDGWTITRNTFRDYQCGNPHSEALYIAAYAEHGLIEHNTFVNNGNTGHIFFTWCSWDDDCASWGGGYKDPHDWSVRGNTFRDTWTADYAISAREELKGNPGLDICVDRHQKVTAPLIRPAPDNGKLARFMYPPASFMLKRSCPDPR